MLKGCRCRAHEAYVYIAALHPMVTSLYELEILERNLKQQTNKQTERTIIGCLRHAGNSLPRPFGTLLHSCPSKPKIVRHIVYVCLFVHTFALETLRSFIYSITEDRYFINGQMQYMMLYKCQ